MKGQILIEFFGKFTFFPLQKLAKLRVELERFECENPIVLQSLIDNCRFISVI